MTTYEAKFGVSLNTTFFNTENSGHLESGVAVLRLRECRTPPRFWLPQLCLQMDDNLSERLFSLPRVPYNSSPTDCHDDGPD